MDDTQTDAAATEAGADAGTGAESGNGLTATLERGGGKPRGDRDAVDKIGEARNPKAVDRETAQDALDWFMADEGEEADPVYTIEVNVSTDLTHPRVIAWQFKPMGSERIDVLRRMFSVPLNRDQRRSGQVAELNTARFNAALVFESTVNPDLQAALATRGESDGARLVTHRFRHKPLLVDQIAGQILEMSGGNEEDVRTAKEVVAAKN